MNTGTFSALLENLKCLIQLDSMTLDFSENPLPTLNLAVIESFFHGVKFSVHLLVEDCSFSLDMIKGLGNLLISRFVEKVTYKIGALRYAKDFLH